jgi:hypothetical protein
MDIPDVAMILGRIEQKIDDQGKNLTDFKDEQSTVNARMETKIDYTNGQVRGLQIWKARAMGVIAVSVFAAPLVLPVLLH